MAPSSSKRQSVRSYMGSLSSSVERSTPPPSPTKERLPEQFTLPGGTTVHRVTAPCHSDCHTIPFNDNGTPGILVKNILNGRCIQDSQETVDMAKCPKITLHWPGYDVLPAKHITVNPDTIQELAVALCSALHKFYLRASKIPPSVEYIPWAFSSQVRLRDIVLMSIHLHGSVWVPVFYVLRK